MSAAPAALAIRELGAGELGRLRPLWLALHAHHLEVDEAVRPGVPPGESWPRRRAQYADWLAHPEAFALVAERSGEIAGYALVSIGPPDDTYLTGRVTANLETMSVDPSERGTGVGSALLDAVRARLAALGAELLFVSALAANAGARRFYEGHGFAATQVLYVGAAARASGGPGAPARGEPLVLAIRPASAADAPAVARLMQELGSLVDPETAARRLRAVGEAAGHEVLVAEAGGRVAGMAGLAVIHRLEHDRPSGRLTVLVVGPEARGRGVGRALIGAVEARARAAGCARLEVTSSGDRPRMRRTGPLDSCPGRSVS